MSIVATSPELSDAIAEVLRMLVEGHATRGEKRVPAINMKVMGYWRKETIIIEIK